MLRLGQPVMGSTETVNQFASIPGFSRRVKSRYAQLLSSRQTTDPDTTMNLCGNDSGPSFNRQPKAHVRSDFIDSGEQQIEMTTGI